MTFLGYNLVLPSLPVKLKYILIMYLLSKIIVYLSICLFLLKRKKLNVKYLNNGDYFPLRGQELTWKCWKALDIIIIKEVFK